MKHICLLLNISMVLLTISCKNQVNCEAEKSKIETILDKYIACLETENIEIYDNIFVHDRHMVNFGTSATERIVGWEVLRAAIEVQNTNLSETNVTQSDVEVNLTEDGSYAWATSVWHFTAKSQDQLINVPIRCSWVLKKINEDWKIVHFHKSIGALI